MNPIEPRFLREHRFDLFYKTAKKGPSDNVSMKLFISLGFMFGMRFFRIPGESMNVRP